MLNHLSTTYLPVVQLYYSDCAWFSKYSANILMLINKSFSGSVYFAKTPGRPGNYLVPRPPGVFEYTGFRI
jgi:hypothetical protein